MLNRILVVDSLRGIAAVIVLFHHIFVIYHPVFAPLQNNNIYLYNMLHTLSNLNVEAVLLFFVISGFSVRLSGEKLNLRKKEDINNYIYKRLKRLLPLYFSALFLAGILHILFKIADQDSFNVINLIGNLLFLQLTNHTEGRWFVPFAGNDPLWSLSFEMFFYWFYPLFIFFIPHHAIRILAAFVFSIAGLAVYQILPNPIALFASHFIIWYAGVVVAEIYLYLEINRRQIRIYFLTLLVLLAIVIIFLLIKPSATINNIKIGLFFAVIWAAVYMFGINRITISFLISKYLVKIFGVFGNASYAIYLFHYPILLSFVTLFGNSLFSIAFAVTVTFSIAIIAEELLKKPKYNFLKRNYL